MVLFDEYLQNLTHIHDDNIINVSDAYLKLTDYDIVSYNSYIILKHGDTPLIVRDFISNILNYDNVYIVLDNKKECPITQNTKILSFLTPLRSVLLRNKNKTDTVLTFHKNVIKNELSDKLLYTSVEDSGFEYYYGCIHYKK